MAYNPNIPVPTNRVQDDIAAMRGNFQHLAPLAQLAPAAGELQAVSALAPYVQALLNSRIVEMGSNSNGEYVRWENGLQLCAFRDSRAMETWFSVINDGVVGSDLYRTSVTTLPFPAAFAEVFEANVSGGRHHTTRTMLVVNNSRTTWEFFCLHNEAAANLNLYVSAFAVGRWK